MADNEIGVNEALKLATEQFQQRNFDDARTLCQKVLAVAPNTHQAYNRLGQIEQELEHHEEAVAMFEEALANGGQGAPVYFNRGASLYALERYDEAMDAFERAASLDPGRIENWNRLSNASRLAGRPLEAREAIWQAFRKNKTHKMALQQLINSYIPLDGNAFDVAQLDRMWATCILLADVDASLIIFFERRAFEAFPIVRRFAEMRAGGHPDPMGDLLADPATATQWNPLHHPLALACLTYKPNTSVALEEFLTALRRGLLARVHHGESIIANGWEGMVTFLPALARQCFINEYVFSYTLDEEAQLEQLIDEVDKALQSGATPSAESLALISCYRSLHTMAFADLLVENDALQSKAVVAALLKMQIAEPREEASIMDTIPQLTPVKDAVSKAVREQYEENPFPRWVSLPPGLMQTTLANFLRGFYSFLPKDQLPTANKPEILVAGCGTGQQPISDAILYGNAHITAVDLSLSSLAYAVRKARELHIENVSFAQGDILLLGDVERKYDAIMCTGVLHHMKDPLAGWRVLVDQLRPGGFMRIGLYSERAREHVVAARDFIADEGVEVSPQGIHRCREAIMAMPEGHMLRRTLESNDFYSLSMCRDYLFHVQEHRFTIPKIRVALDSLGLEFIGFISPSETWIEAYHNRFPDDPKCNNLDNWDVFEAENPDTFITMYQFWVRKLP